MFKKAILNAQELVARLIEIRQGHNIPLGADRIYTCESVARDYARNHTDIATEAASLILTNADELVSSTGVSPLGLGIIYKLLGGNAAAFPYNEICARHGYAA